jgi:hypothetical protein
MTINAALAHVPVDPFRTAPVTPPPRLGAATRIAHRPNTVVPVIDPLMPTMNIAAWHDDVVDANGHDPRSDYVERFWLGILGPSTTWLLRSLAWGLESYPDGFELHLADTAKALGLGDRLGRQSPFVRALSRLCQYDLAAMNEADLSLAVRRRVPWLSRRMVIALPPGLRAEHTQWEIVAAAARHPSRSV